MLRSQPLISKLIVSSGTPTEVYVRSRRVMELASRDFVCANAQQMSEEVMYRHIDLYVNKYSIDLGIEGKQAVEMLFERGKATNMIPDSKETLFFCS